ncbi:MULTISPECIES: peptidylprolyl isomerase [Methylomicrobium]|uniref:Chaperone SurA n=1 Tax=Methylomicrobium album BG8 TaxID=686340 RepID=H8GJI7_METAL|nr:MULTISPECIES: peptidylprolyl isomerase [Methylomicrobium]EIC30347.1 parvulin-like peptidyl-prolyl isomerase [Methylomicrobium album BG8]
MKQFFIAFFLLHLLTVTGTARAEMLDTIVAIVEDDVVLERELEKESYIIAERMRSSNVAMPSASTLRHQVLEKLIIDKLQRQLAEKAGITVSDEMLNSSVTEIARNNNMSPDEFRNELISQGMAYKSFLDNVRNEIMINQLRAREIGARIKVTDREIEHYLDTQGKIGTESVQYRLGHILIAVKEGASASEIQTAQSKASDLVAKLRRGQDFTHTAVSNSDDDNALSGGDLGWRNLNEIPTLFADTAQKMAIGEVSEPIRSPSGFHIIKLIDSKGTDNHTVTKTEVRHILIKTNELIDDNEAKKRLLALKTRITDGDDFAALARAHSDDKGSALKGGSLGKVNPGDLVKEFEEAMNRLAVKEISDPVQTQFGWHLIQVLDRETKDNSEEHQKNLAREAIRKRKIEEETELWIRRIRDEAYVEIYEDRL